MRRTALAVALAALLAAAPTAAAHQGNPKYLSQVDSITPPIDGVTVDVLNRDDRLLLHNTSGEDVVIGGYDGEPYARVLADGTVQVNTDSEAYYLNEDRFADVDVPAGVDSKGAPPVPLAAEGEESVRWKEIDRTGRFEWHDHRAHWMGTDTPPQVNDESVRTRLYGWSVPLEVGGTAGAIRGTLFWTPPPGGDVPLGLIFGVAGTLIALCIVVIAVRRRRAEREPAAAW